MFPAAFDDITSCRPSGDQFACPDKGLSKCVSWVGFDPSRSQIHTSSNPERREPNAIVLPSGEYRGKLLNPADLPEVMNRAGDRPSPPASGPPTRQRSIVYDDL